MTTFYYGMEEQQRRKYYIGLLCPPDRNIPWFRKLIRVGVDRVRLLMIVRVLGALVITGLCYSMPKVSDTRLPKNRRRSNDRFFVSMEVITIRCWVLLYSVIRERRRMTSRQGILIIVSNHLHFPRTLILWLAVSSTGGAGSLLRKKSPDCISLVTDIKWPCSRPSVPRNKSM